MAIAAGRSVSAATTTARLGAADAVAVTGTPTLTGVEAAADNEPVRLAREWRSGQPAPVPEVVGADRARQLGARGARGWGGGPAEVAAPAGQAG